MKINDSQFYVPPTRRELKIAKHLTLLHCLGGAFLGCLIAVLLFRQLVNKFCLTLNSRLVFSFGAPMER